MPKPTKSRRRENMSGKTPDQENERVLTLDDLFEILGNPHRREIIKLLSQEERYAFELAKLLNISQRAVTKHLESLSRLQLVTTREVPSNQGPQRKYYALDTGWILSVSIGPKVYQTIIKEIWAEPEEELIQRITDEIRRGKTIDILWNAINEFTKIDDEIQRIEDKKIALLRKRTSYAEAIDQAFSQLGFNSTQREILRILIEKGGTMYLTELVEHIQEDIDTIKESIESLQDQEIIMVTWLSPNEARIAIQNS